MKLRFKVSACLALLFWAVSAQAVDFTQFGYYRVAAVSPKLVIGNPMKNAELTFDEAVKADAAGAAVTVFPELGLTGYTAEDLLLQQQLIDDSNRALEWLMKKSLTLKTALVVGVPYRTTDGRLYNAAAVIAQGKVLGIVPKSHLPNYGEFYDRRWFTPGGKIEVNISDPLLGKFHLGTRQLFKLGEMVFGIEICEDLWAPLPPSTHHALAGANVILNLSASNETAGKAETRKSLVGGLSDRLLAGYVYVSSGPGESSKDLVFGGHSLIYEAGSKLAEGERFKLDGQTTYADIDVQKLIHERQRNTTFANQEPLERYKRVIEIPVLQTLPKLGRKYAKSPFVPTEKADLDARSDEIIQIQATGLARRLQAAKSKTMVIGVSGGLDSTLALLVANEAAKMLGWSPKQIIGITLPGFGTTTGTKSSAIDLMNDMGITSREIGITAAVTQHFKDIGHDPSVHDTTYENAQARERTQILFDIANKEGGIVVGTGDLSELCIGWCTFNGDHMSNYGVNASVPKTLVKYLVKHYADRKAAEGLRKTLIKILETEISPELLPPSADGKIQQATEDLIGPYELHDFFIYYYLRDGFPVEKIYHIAVDTFQGVYTPEVIKKWLRVFVQRYYSSQFKRTTIPAGPKVGSVSISPRGDLRMPDEASCDYLLLRIDALKSE